MVKRIDKPVNPLSEGLLSKDIAGEFTFSRNVGFAATIRLMFTTPAENSNTIYVSMTDTGSPLSAYAAYEFELDDRQWPTVEHYYQAMKFRNAALAERIRNSRDAAEARSVAKRNFWRIRFDWKKLRKVVMTRATYTKCMTYPHIATALLDTGDRPIVEQSQYDYYWGRGRDGRGKNQYGAVLMNVRRKLAEQNS